jgi:hypothetical protein
LPLNGSDIATPVPGFNTVAANTTILSSLHNNGINDIFTILNSPRQFAHGALGGTTQITNWDNLTAKGTDVASASTINLTTATGPRIDISGTVAITAVTLANGSMRIARATGIFVLTASATLIVNKSTSVNYTTAVGDLMIFTAEGGVTSVTVIGSSSASSATTSNASFINFAIGTPSVAASALTIPFNGIDGNAFSASNTGYVNFRSATAGSGAIAQLALIAAMSLVISSGSTLGMTSGVAATLALAIFNDAGTARPAIINPLTLPLVDGIASATSEGGAGAADSAGVWYSNAAITSKAYTIVGYITVTEATAGTWATAPSVTKVDAAAAVNNQYPRTVVTASVATTSGSAIAFTNIPPNTCLIIVNLIGVSTNGTALPVVQIGPAGGLVTSGYLGSIGNTGTAVNISSGFPLVTSGASASVLHGNIILSLEDAANNTWSASTNIGRSDAAQNNIGGGSVSLSGPINRLSLVTTDAFDLGKANITYVVAS